MKRSIKEIIVRLLIMTIGLIVAHLGVSLFISSNLGTDPFNVFVQGIYRTVLKMGAPQWLTHGTVFTVVCFVIIIVLLIVDKSYIKIGTIACLFLGGPILDVWNLILAPLVNADASMVIRIVAIVVGCIFMACGMSIVIKSDAGTGPNDLVALVISDKSKKKFSIIRICVDVFFVVVGFLLGGTFGIGTIACAFLIGPVAGFFLPRVERIVNNIMEKTV